MSKAQISQKLFRKVSSKKGAQGSLKLLKKFNQKEAAQGSLEYIETFGKVSSKKGSQGSLEYIIIIGGIIILSVATYFMLRSFTQTTSAGTSDTIGVAGETLRLELENLGRSEISFSSKSWGSYPQASTLDISNSGGSTSTELTLNNLTDYGLDTDNLEFAYNDSGSMQFLPYTHASPVTVTLPDLGTGITTLLIFQNNSSALELDNVNHSSPDPNVTVEDGTSPVERPDNSSPTISIPSIVEGPLDSIEIEVNISGTGSRVSESYHSIENSPWIPADNYYYEYGGITSVAYPSDGSYDSENETVRIFLNVPSEDNYTVKIRAVDEYGNEKVETQEVEILTEIPPDTAPPAIQSTQPANNSRVTDLSLTINITTDETAHCRFSNASGTGYSSMTDFNATDSTVHNITGLNLSLGQNYKYYFKCNDTSGNVNPSDYLLNFTAIGWGPDVMLSGGGPKLALRPRIVANGNNLHVLWHDNRSGDNAIYYKNSSNGGESWNEEYNLSESSARAKQPEIALSENNVHAMWQDNRDGYWEVYYKNSSDGGVSWNSDYHLSNGTGYSHIPSIVVNGSNIHVVWHDRRNTKEELFYKNSTDGGTTWTNDSLFTEHFTSLPVPSIGVDGSNVHLVWPDNRSGNYEIYYRNSSDGGTIWNSEYNLTNDSAHSDVPWIAVNGNNLHVVWRDMRDGDYELYYKNSSDSGTTWGNDYRLTNDPETSASPWILVDDNNLHLVWHDNRSGNYEIFYKTSTDGGITWGTGYQLTSDPANSSNSLITVNGNDLHVVWRDDRSGNYEIYYKKYYGG